MNCVAFVTQLKTIVHRKCIIPLSKVLPQMFGWLGEGRVCCGEGTGQELGVW